MITSTIKISDTLSASLEGVQRQASPERCAKIAARIAAACFVIHFERLSRERHRAVMAHDFYLQAARATSGRADGGNAIVEVKAPTGLRQRLKGGEIKPTKQYKLRRGKTTITYSALWIPVGAAIGRTGGDYRGALRVIWNTTTLKGVALDKTTQAVLFALVGSVRHEKDPSVSPDVSVLRNAVIVGVADKLRAAWLRQHPED